MTRTPRFARALLIGFAVLAAVPSAWGWGCKGHQIVALIAEQHMTAHARDATLQILAASPIDPSLARYCQPIVPDPFADSSTWADDERKVKPDTGPWHFVDIPRSARESDIAKYCPPVTGCVTSALADEVRILRDPKAAPQARADALRFLIHFVGDIHQPLHSTTNNDLGGNCVPVAFFDRAPVESKPLSGVFYPNLHEVWDVEIVEHFSPGEPASQVAKKLDQKFSAKESAWESQPADFPAWAWESHQLAESTVYGRLPHAIPIQTPRSITSCADDASRAAMSQLDEKLGDDYQNAAAPVAQEQLAKAGVRLAALLNSIWR
ncbi:MAG: S1/P1 nuclease [Candidatus Acidiferrales bacterium]|jgi:hypothetical protein